MLLFAVAAAATPLAPIGKWNMDYQPTNCILAREYGDAKKPVTIAWVAVPLMDGADVMIAEPRRDSKFTRGTVTMEVGSREETGYFFSYPVGSGDRHVTRVMASLRIFDGLNEPVAATFHLHPGKTFSYTIENGAGAMAALHACLDRTVIDWGLDPKALAKIKTAATPIDDEATWLTPKDYPPSEDNAGQEGFSLLLWKIDTLGHVANCRAVVPSGSLALDKAGCDAITRRGRYTPARDSAGQAVDSYKVRKVIWATFGGLASGR